MTNCTICQQAKTLNTSPAGLLQPLPIPAQVWEDISMDFITGLPNSGGYTAILVVVDRLSKYAHFMPMKSDYTAKQVAELFFNTVVKLHGMPKSIVSDRDKVFTSIFWQHLFKLQGTTLAMSSSYHPQTDGQTEAVNKCLEMFLRCYTFENPKAWAKALSWAELWYNSSYHTSAGMTPFQAVYGKPAPSFIKYNLSPNDPPEVQQLLMDRDDILQKLKANLEKSQNRMKNQANKHRQDKEFKEGDLVLVKLQPYKQHSLQLRRNQKLSLRYFGPFPITQRIGKVAYRLQLPPTARIHPIFHISMLKQFRGDLTTQYFPLPEITTEQGPVLRPKSVLQHRVITVANLLVPQVLIEWEGLPVNSATWEDVSVIQEHYPNINLGDKVEVKGGGIVMHQNAKRENMKNSKDKKGNTRELVMEVGHVVTDAENKELGRGKRVRITNTNLKDYVC